MIRRIEWSDEAAQDFQEAIEYIALDSESAGRLVAQRILDAIDKLGELPTGHPGRVKGIYEKLVQKTPYIVAYRISDNRIYVARIIHGARFWPEGEWPAE
ncbi:MAG: type II toxin-antitoxin system RelE/ParE family toxin [Rhizobiaceae bacterium]